MKVRIPVIPLFSRRDAYVVLLASMKTRMPVVPEGQDRTNEKEFEREMKKLKRGQMVRNVYETSTID